MSEIVLMSIPRVAVLIPCHNEALTIARVVTDFRAALPHAVIYVYDNNSTDATTSEARAAGAEIRSETRQGKGHVVRRMFRDIEADYYLMVDGDGTYDAGAAPDMLACAQSGPYDLVNGLRIAATGPEVYRQGHRLGNALLTGAVRKLFGDRIQDMLSGYKVFSRRFVKSFPVLSNGFDIETELTVHALSLEMPVAHISSGYFPRPDGSQSKLRTYHDGFRILLQILQLFRHERPLALFSAASVALALLSLALGLPVILAYLHTGLVLRFPTAFLALGLGLMSGFSLMTGLVLDTVSRGRKELRMLAYLQIPAYRARFQIPYGPYQP